MKNRIFKLFVLTFSLIFICAFGPGVSSRAEDGIGDPTVEIPAPPKTKITKITSTKDSITVKWQKKKGIDGYEIEYSTKKNMDDSEFVTVKSAKSGSKKITKLKPGTTYYVLVCTYVKDGGDKEYSKDSAVKKIKTKGNAETGEQKKNVSKSDRKASDAEAGMVWISGGARYHRLSTCSNMKNPIKVSLEEAKKRGKTPCKTCY